MTRYCFIANYYLTPLFAAIARGLQSTGIECTWITVNRQQRNELVQAGWTAEQVLYLPLPLTTEYQPFTQFPVKFFDLLTADRALRQAPALGIAYLHNAAQEILNFLQSQRIDFVFGEATWAHERLTSYLCRHMAATKFLVPHPVRFPANRWGFFEGDNQAQLAVRHTVASQDCVPTDKHHNCQFDATPPSYVKRNDELLEKSKSLQARLSRVKRFFTRENIDSRDPTFVQSRVKTFQIAGSEELNRLLYRFTPRIDISTQMLGRPFILYALHKQPESSIDVLGRYYEDQAKLIHAIWRTLPSGWWLYIKEHSNAIGDRSQMFYRRLLRLPNVLLINEKEPAARLISACQAVFTVSGTVAYEAALLNKPSFTFAPMFFNSFPSCRQIGIDDLRDADDLRSLLPIFSSADTNDPKDYVLQHSFAGRFSDVRTDPSVLEQRNLECLISGFLAVAAEMNDLVDG